MHRGQWGELLQGVPNARFEVGRGGDARWERPPASVVYSSWCGWCGCHCHCLAGVPLGAHSSPQPHGPGVGQCVGAAPPPRPPPARPPAGCAVRRTPLPRLVGSTPRGTLAGEEAQPRLATVCRGLTLPGGGGLRGGNTLSAAVAAAHVRGGCRWRRRTRTCPCNHRGQLGAGWGPRRQRGMPAVAAPRRVAVRGGGGGHCPTVSSLPMRHQVIDTYIFRGPPHPMLWGLSLVDLFADQTTSSPSSL